MIHFWDERCRKFALSQKKFQMKVFQHRISDKKCRKGICVSPTRVEPVPRKKIWCKYEIVQKSKNTLTLGLNGAKNMHYPKKSFK